MPKLAASYSGKCSHLVHLILCPHVASKIIGKQEPVIALGHVIDIVHQVFEVLSMAEFAISDPACQQRTKLTTVHTYMTSPQEAVQANHIMSLRPSPETR